MTYKCTRARKTFETQIEQALKELVPLYKIAIRASGGGGPRLLAAYYVFAFAQLEVYVKSFVEDSVSAVKAASPTFNKWPDLMMAYLLHKNEELGAGYRKYGINEDEAAILQKVAETARKVAEWGNGTYPFKAIDASDYLDRKKYPSPKNLPQLFRRLGVKQIWAVVSAKGKMNSELVLISLNDLRTDIAHEGKVPTGFGLSDFKDRIRQMRAFVAALDRGVSQHFCEDMMSRREWNSFVV